MSIVVDIRRLLSVHSIGGGAVIRSLALMFCQILDQLRSKVKGQPLRLRSQPVKLDSQNSTRCIGMRNCNQCNDLKRFYTALIFYKLTAAMKLAIDGDIYRMVSEIAIVG